MIIEQRRTSNGYVLELVCERCCASVKRLDAQQPLWGVVVALSDHNARDHNTSTSDDAVGTAYYRHPGRKVEDVQLPGSDVE